MISSHATEGYFPPPESEGGWRWLDDPAQIREHGGMDAERLKLIRRSQEFLHGGDTWAYVVIRHGWLVEEAATFNMLAHTRFDIWSCTKSFTGTAWGILFDDSRRGLLPGGVRVEMDTPAYDFIPEGHPLTDPRKAAITFRHLLSMTSGIPGEDHGMMGTPTALGHGPFEHALGRSPNRHGYWADKLAAEPGTRWEYSDPAISHLALAHAHITGREIEDVIQQRVCAAIGIEHLAWDVHGGSGFLGPHTNAHTGVHLSARELARFGYLALHGGMWAGQEIVPRWWMELATRASQPMNPAYGYTWWVNTDGGHWPGSPVDMFALEGYRCNRCYIIPSLDLVVARVGTGPAEWNEPNFIRAIVAAVAS